MVLNQVLFWKGFVPPPPPPAPSGLVAPPMLHFHIRSSAIDASLDTGSVIKWATNRKNCSFYIVNFHAVLVESSYTAIHVSVCHVSSYYDLSFHVSELAMIFRVHRPSPIYVGVTFRKVPAKSNFAQLCIWSARSRWSCCLRRNSEVAWLLGSRVRMPLNVWMFVSSVCCVGSGLSE